MILTSEQLRSILGQAPAEAMEDTDNNRRSVPRMALGCRAQLLGIDGGPRRWSRVMLQDISVKGIGFLGQIPMRVGDRFVLQVTDCSNAAVYIQCAARRSECGGVGGVSYVVGATFEKLLNVADLPHESTTHICHRGLAEVMAHALASLRQLNPVRLLRHSFKRFDDYSSLDDMKWFHRSP